nr:MAG TPA: hypothetical protein [Caudoviricetes sp.]
MEEEMSMVLEDGPEIEITGIEEDEGAGNQGADGEATGGGAENDGGEPESADGGEADEGGGEGQQQDASGAESGETFTLKVLGVEQTVGRDEVIQLAQKGKDYDRVKEASERLKTEVEGLRDFRSKNEADLRELRAYMEESGAESVSDILDAMRISAMAAKGVSREVAAERVKNARLQRQLQEKEERITADETQQRKVQGDLNEFRKAYPDVAVDKSLLEQLADDIRVTGNLTAAYQRRENRRLSKELEKAKSDLAAEKQNQSNKQRSGGSQKSSSGNSETWLDQFQQGLLSDDD